MTETRLFWMNCNMLLLLTLGSTISILLSSGSLAKIIAPIIEVTILISSSLRSCLNNILTTAKYKEYKLFRPFPSLFDWSMKKSFLRVDLKKFGSSGYLDKNTSSTRNQITKSLCNPSRFHSHGVKLWLEKCTDVIRSTIFWLNITARGNIDMCADVVREHFGNSILWSACNHHLELLQVIGLNLALEYM